MTDPHVVEQALRLRLAIGQVARRLRWLYARRSAQRGIGFLEVALLVRLDRDGPSSPTRLAGAEGITSQAVSLAIASLTDRDLVTREPDENDRRRVVLAVTDAGRAALHDSEESAIQALVTALMSLSAAERAALATAEPALMALAERLRDAERSES